VIAYLDTSALVPLLVDELTSGACRRLWDDADDVVSSRLAYIEAAAALSQARRLGRLSARGYRAALTGLAGLWSQMQIVAVDQPLVERSARIADRFALRGYDAVHCASAELISGETVVAAGGDRQLLAAWQALGLSTYDTTS
jgi:predicted nucleic acid-binding protein